MTIPNQNSSTYSGKGFRFSLRILIVSVTFWAVGLGLCRLEYGTQFWGNWLHTASFNLGAALICVGVGIFIARALSIVAGLIAAFSLLALTFVFLWTYPGWLMLHSLVSRLSQ
jgi:hypothetical protein